MCLSLKILMDNFHNSQNAHTHGNGSFELYLPSLLQVHYNSFRMEERENVHETQSAFSVEHNYLFSGSVHSRSPNQPNPITHSHQECQWLNSTWPIHHDFYWESGV